MSNIKLLGDRVLIDKKEATETTKSGFIIKTEEMKLTILEGVVTHLGKGKYESGKLISMEEIGIKVGDTVKYQNRLKTKVDITGKTLDLVSIDDVILIK